MSINKEMQQFLLSHGVKKVSDELASDLGDHLMKKVKESAKRLANILREENRHSKK